MFAFLALAALGLVLFGAGVIANDRTLRGEGVLAAFSGFVGALFVTIRWLIYRGIV
jgi:hypothetical protein